jgi:hypothetical protein
MANPHKRGEVEFEVDGKPHIMSFSVDALAELEEALGGKSINEIGAQIQNPATFKVGILRMVFWAGLLDSHEGQITLDESRKIFRRMKLGDVVDVVGRAFALAFPEAAKDAAPASPQQPDGAAASGTGPAS